MAIAEQDKPQKKMGPKMEAFIDRLGELLGFVTICLIAFLYIDAYFHFIKDLDLVGLLWQVREVAIILVVGLKGMEIVLRGNSFIMFCIYAAIFAVVIIFCFFPETGLHLIQSIRK